MIGRSPAAGRRSCTAISPATWPGKALERGDVAKGLPKPAWWWRRPLPPGHQPCYLGHACIASVDSYQGLTLYTALQSPHIVRNLLAETLDLPPSRVRIVGPAMGGGFGGRVFGTLKVYLLSALLAMHTGAPVKIRLTREEEFIAGRPMVPVVFKVRMGVRRDGTITARESDILVDNGAYSAQGPWVAKTISERNDSLYRIPHIRTRVRLAYTNKVPTGQMRTYGNRPPIMPTRHFWIWLRASWAWIRWSCA